MPSFSYFAYGSNMLAERLQAEDRSPSARVIGSAIAQGYELCFAKRGRDGSGKATLVQRTGAMVHGVLFAVDESERDQLKSAEGAGIGYHAINNFPVFDVQEKTLRHAMSFFAAPDYFNRNLQPFDWYHALVTAGAKQNALPHDHLQTVRKIKPIADPIEARPTRIEALRVLRQAGFENLLG
jgi:gamma-glutamylcyclotransferase